MQSHYLTQKLFSPKCSLLGDIMNSLDTSTLGWSPGLLGAYITWNVSCYILLPFALCLVPHLSNGESDRVPFVRLIIHCISHVGLHLVVDATRLSCNIKSVTKWPLIAL